MSKLQRKGKRKNNFRSRPRQADLRDLTMSLKDEAEQTKALRHPELLH